MALGTFLLIGVFHYLWTHKTETVEAADTVLASVTFGTTIAFMQMLGIFDKLHFHWPVYFQHFLDLSKIFVLDFTFIPVGCFFQRGFSQLFPLKLLAPIAINLQLLSWYFIFRLWHTVVPGSRLPEISLSGILISNQVSESV